MTQTTGDEGFNAQIDKTLAFEGGYVDDPDDAGGETNFGISKAAYPHLDIANLTRDDAINIYRTDYWYAPGIDALNQWIGAKVFDLGVNMGPQTAIKLLQRATNHFPVAPDLRVDGIIGPRTIAKVNGISPITLLPALKTEARNHYLALAANNSHLNKFLAGWLRRAVA